MRYEKDRDGEDKDRKRMSEDGKKGKASRRETGDGEVYPGEGTG